MQQKRLRRKARRDSRAPYHWLPNRKAGRSNSNSSMSSEGSLDLDFEDSVWKPDVKADMKSEFIMAWSSNGCTIFEEDWGLHFREENFRRLYTQMHI